MPSLIIGLVAALAAVIALVAGYIVYRRSAYSVDWQAHIGPSLIAVGLVVLGAAIVILVIGAAQVLA